MAKAPVLKTGGRKPLQVRILCPPSSSALFVGRFARNLYRLAKLEPQRFKWCDQGWPFSC
jgi:hypothetical protein